MKRIELDELPEVGLRAPWHKTEEEWRDVLLSASTPGWNIGWLNLHLGDAATEEALKIFHCPTVWPLPIAPASVFVAARERAIEPITDERPTFDPN